MCATGNYSGDAHHASVEKRTFATHTKSDFYTGNTKKHYHYHRFWIPKIRAVSVGQPMFFKYQYVRTSTYASLDDAPRLGMHRHAV